MLVNRLAWLITTLFLSLSLLACAGSYKHTLDFNPNEPIRIAVLPFVQIDAKGRMIDTDGELLIDSVEIVSSKLKDTPAHFVQELVQSELTKAALDVLTPAIVEAELIHKAYTIPGSNPAKLDLKRVLATDPSSLCSDLLSCDAVLYGRVTKWDRSYYGIETVATVGVDLKLVSAKTNNLLFEAQAEDSDSRGLTKGPTGLSSLVLEPIRGLDNTIVTDLARDVVSEAISPLHADHRPDFLSSAPPALIASAHDASDGVIDRGTKLTVVALGTPGHTASFSIGSAIIDVPMVERRAGQYVGEFFPLDSDSFKKQLVTVSLKDQFGRVTTQKLAKILVTY